MTPLPPMDRHTSSATPSPHPIHPALSSSSSSDPTSPTETDHTTPAPPPHYDNDVDSADPDALSSSPDTPSPRQQPRSPQRDSPPASAGTIPQNPQPRTRAQATTSRGGCWTCRLRRKKCDEIRNGDSCQTCIRLRIRCLGWGPRRPDWMRDKQAVEKYKADIKAQLTRAGLIRGQPRASTLAAQAEGENPAVLPAPPRGAPTAYAPIHPHPGAHPHGRGAFAPYPSPHLGMAGPGPSSRAAGTEYAGAVAYAGMHAQDAHHQMMLPSLPSPSSSRRHTAAPSPSSPFDPSGLEPLYPYLASTSSGLATPSGLPGDMPPFDPFAAFAASAGSAHPSPYDYEPSPTSLPPPAPVPRSFNYALLPLGQDTLEGQCVMYYFEHVCRMQWVFAGPAITELVFSLILQDPQGPLAAAICATASLHNARVRQQQGLETTDPGLPTSTPRLFADRARALLVAPPPATWDEPRALALVHLVGYALLAGRDSGVRWEELLEMGLEWMEVTGITRDENPKLRLLHMNNASKIAVKIIMWLDVMASITLLRPPKFLSCYRRLLGVGAGYWGHMGQRPTSGSVPASISPALLFGDAGADLALASLTGVPDEALLAIAEASALEWWARGERRRGSLSVRELVRRADAAERAMRARADSDAGQSPDVAQMHRARHSQHGSPAGFDVESTGSASVVGDLAHISGTLTVDEVRRRVGAIYREAAALYLHTVVSGCYPDVPEISQGASRIASLLAAVPLSELDRTLVFPLCIAGCLTDAPGTREALRVRLATLDGSVGNVLQVCGVVEAVWVRRGAQGGAPVEWREVLSEGTMKLLLV